MHTTASPPSALVQADDIIKVFGGRVRALDGVSLTLRPGEIYGLIGGNGAGKTTFMRILVGLARPTSGRFRFADSLGAGAVGSLIAPPPFYERMTGLDNVRLLARYWNVADADVWLCLDGVGLSRDDQTRPVREYSLGMRQRLAIAEALLGDPEVLVLDEPTNGLDPASVVEIRGLIESLRDDGRSILLSSHVLSEVERTADRVGILKKGRLVAEGTMSELRRRAEGSGRLRITVDDVEIASMILHRLGVGPDDIAVEGDTVTLPLAVRSSQEVNARLVEHGVGVRALEPVAGSLEDLYFELTNGDESTGQVMALAAEVAA
jgi:ABC-2 type transport system ATP-binding protein